ncbi:isochorismate synthase [Rhodococcus daqingensis]|uniref:isochorismate synthase n=1 Tax=Rhodococcus daqingensis TaxID=2479363 RepID=A0ABW2RX48_9NOCA
MRRRFDDTDSAISALRDGTTRIIAGALPFDHSNRCALIEPSAVSRNSPLPGRTPATRGTLRIRSSEPTPDEHARRVGKAVAMIRSGELEKVVLARRLVLESTVPIDPIDVLDRLVRRDHASNGYLVDLSTSHTAGPVLVGSSPEVLIRRSGRTVSCFPLAGSAPRSSDPLKDRAHARMLRGSGKDLREHAFVVDSVRAALAELCVNLQIPAGPDVIATPQMWHLGTAISGELRDPELTALDLARQMHPTPAVCGTPRTAAQGAIADIEGDRGLYAGAVGWCDAAGDGEWMVTIRCAEISADGRTLVAFAGGGIVADSDPTQELAETTAKFGTILDALDARGLERRRA